MKIPRLVSRFAGMTVCSAGLGVAVAAATAASAQTATQTSAQTNAQASPVVIVVNAANPVTSVSRSMLSDVFLKRTTRWPGNKTAAMPVDLARSSAVRDAFTKTIHRRSTASVRTYWQQQIFGGKEVPPPEKNTDADVLVFVRANPGAVGYVAATTPLGSGVKVLAVR